MFRSGDYIFTSDAEMKRLVKEGIISKEDYENIKPGFWHRFFLKMKVKEGEEY